MIEKIGLFQRLKNYFFPNYEYIDALNDNLVRCREHYCQEETIVNPKQNNISDNVQTETNLGIAE